MVRRTVSLLRGAHAIVVMARSHPGLLIAVRIGNAGGVALGLGEGSEVRAPMAITVIGGLALSTLLTLVVIPVVYDLLDRKSDEAFVASHTPIALDPAGEGGA